MVESKEFAVKGGERCVVSKILFIFIFYVIFMLYILFVFFFIYYFLGEVRKKFSKWEKEEERRETERKSCGIIKNFLLLLFFYIN